MEPYGHDNVQALDYTSHLNRETDQNRIDSSILDLSCKKHITGPIEVPNTRTVCFDSALFANANQLQTQSNSLSRMEKTPEARGSFILTPFSDSNSPKSATSELKYDNRINDALSMPCSVLSLGVPIPMVTSNQPPLLASGEATKQVPMSLSSTATSTTHPTEMELAVSADIAKKAPRPFKAYPKDPLSLTVGTTDFAYDHNSNEAYTKFRRKMLESVKKVNEGTNSKMRRISKSPVLPTSTVDEKDAAYWERRRKNNEAAKRSRDARRAKEDEIAIRAAFLEQENMRLKYELMVLRNEAAKLRCMMYSS